MKKIKLYDYQQEVLENIIKVLTTAATGRFYDENGKSGQFGDGADANRYGKDLRDGGSGEMVP